MKKMITIGLAEDHVIVREGFVALLSQHRNFKVLFDVNNGKELIEALHGSLPDIIILDIDMPVMGGREALSIINIKYPQTKVIILSVHFEDFYIIEFIKNGAKAFLKKGCSFNKLVEAINAVCEHGHYYDDNVSAVMAKELSHSATQNAVDDKIHLTKREKEILTLLRHHKTNSEMATILGISSRTVEGHRQRLMNKMGYESSETLISLAV